MPLALERNAKLSFAHASTNAMKANFTYTGSLDELQETFAKEAKTYDSVALFAQVLKCYFPYHYQSDFPFKRYFVFVYYVNNVGEVFGDD